MKLFGNSRRRSVPQNRTPAPAQPAAKGDGGNPTRAIILFCLAVAVFVGVIVMSLLLIRRSGEDDYEPPETQIKEVEYVVGGEIGMTTEPTEQMPELVAPASVNDSDILSILFLTPDSDTGRTDTMMLFKIDLSTKELGLLSLPRDTYISGNYELPKLQQVYHKAEGGDRGAQALKEKVKEMVGYWPDYYFVLDQQTLSLMLALAGGSVEFDVPTNPSYSELNSGRQSITGASALELLQYREDYSQIETDSTKVQRDFLLKLLSQLVNSSKNVMTTAEELSNVVDTDLTDLDLAFLLDFLKKANLNSTYSSCLPGKSITVQGVSFFQVDIEKAVSLLNNYFSPLEEDLSVYDVNFRQLTGDSGEGNYSDFGFGNATTKPTNNSMPTPSTQETEAPTESTQAPTELPDGP